MAIILVLYGFIGLALRRSSSISNTNSSASHHHSPHHLCGQAAKSPHSIQRSNNSILLDNSSSPTATLIYNDNKSVTFCTNGKPNNRTNALINSSGEQLDTKSDQLRSDQHNKLNNFLNKNDKDVNSLKNSLSSPSALKSMRQFNGSGNLRPSPNEQQELIELNNNQVNSQLSGKPNGKPNSKLNHQNSKSSAPLLLSIHNGTTLAAHRPSDLMMNSQPTANVGVTINSTLNSSAFNSSTLNTASLNALNPANNHNLNSAISPTVNSAITPTAVAISAGNSIHHHRHNQAAASRRSVIKMLGKSILLFLPWLDPKESYESKFQQRWNTPAFSSERFLCALGERYVCVCACVFCAKSISAKYLQIVFMKCEFIFKNAQLSCLIVLPLIELQWNARSF